MSHFYASIQGNRGEATRQGTEKTGICGHVRGWDIGCYVRCYVDCKNEDVVSVSITGGSNGYGHNICLGEYKNINGKLTKI